MTTEKLKINKIYRVDTYNLIEQNFVTGMAYRFKIPNPDFVSQIHCVELTNQLPIGVHSKLRCARKTKKPRLSYLFNFNGQVYGFSLSDCEVI